MNTRLCKPSTRSVLRGFSLVEMLVVVGFMSMLCGIGVVAVTKTREAGQRTKLEADVSTLNRSVRIYLGNGGDLPKSATASEILTRLKMKVEAADASALVGHTGPFLDPRVTGVSSLSEKGPLRAVWNGKTMRFALDTKGDGFSEFVLDDKLGAQELKTETRQTLQKFATRDSWVWDYDGNATAAPKAPPRDADIAATIPVVFTPQVPTAPGRLLPPQFSVPGGLYDYARFPMPVQLTNPNPNGSSRIFYSLNGGRWSMYSPGTVIELPQDQLDATLHAYSAPINGEEWIDSSSTTSLYQTIFFRGGTSGLFHDPKGDTGQVTNLRNKIKLSTFTWGSPAGGGDKSNRLDFSGVSNFFALPDQEFKIGDITYDNGTTWSGTNSRSVEMEVGLNLTVPESLERLNFTLKLQSTPNNGRNADADADYVWIPTLASRFSAKVQGQTFYLQLRFGRSTANSFTTIDEFHVHEGKRATGAIFGTLTTRPVL